MFILLKRTYVSDPEGVRNGIQAEVCLSAKTHTNELEAMRKDLDEVAIHNHGTPCFIKEEVSLLPIDDPWVKPRAESIVRQALEVSGYS